MTEFVLIPSPLTAPAPLAPLARELGGAAIQGAHPDGAPYWRRWAEAIAGDAVRNGKPVTLVGHSGAGPGLPLVVEAVNALGGSVDGLVYLDATIPGAYASWLASYTDAAGEVAAQAARRDGLVPNPWRSPARWAALGIAPAQAEGFAAECRDVPLAWYEDPYPEPTGIAQAFLGFEPNPFYGPMRDLAASRGWPVATLPGHHFQFLEEPGRVAAVIRTLATTTPGN